MEPKLLFPAMVPLLCMPCYRDRVFVGVVIAAGGLTESLVRHAGQALLSHFQALPHVMPDPAHTFHLEDATEMILRVFETYAKQSRVIVPLLDVLDQLFSADVFQDLSETR